MEKEVADKLCLSSFGELFVSGMAGKVRLAYQISPLMLPAEILNEGLDAHVPNIPCNKY